MKVRESGVRVPVVCKYCGAGMVFIPMRSGNAMPCNPPIWPVTTSASCSCRGTRTIATKSQSPVTE